MHRSRSNIVALAVAALAFQACQEQREPTEPTRRAALTASMTPADPAGRHLVVFAAERVPADLGERVARLGGTVEAALGSIGVAAVTGLSETGAAELAASADIRAVEPDPITRGHDDDEATDDRTEQATSEVAVPADATASPTTARFYARQWNMRAVFANQAWAAGFLGSRDVKGTIAAFERAVNYAFRKGALLVTVPFNDGADLDHNGDLVRLPCEAANAICVAGTGPTGAAGVNGPWQNVDAPAWYTAFGRSAVSVAAPAGAGPPPTVNVWLPCTTTPSQTAGRPDCLAGMAITHSRGTSFAAPHVAGLAALLVAQLGHGNPALIRARILQSADDLGEPGTDPYYGKGRINVARALGIIR